MPKDLGKSRRNFDEAAVDLCYATIKSWNNPFNHSTSIIGLSSGIAVPENVQTDLLNAENIGKTQLETFISSRIESNEIDFYTPIKKNKLHTFDSAAKQIFVMKVKDRDVAIKSDRETFARLLVIQKSRNVSIKEVLSFELSPVPLALANPDATLSKTAKSKLFTSLSEFIDIIATVPINTAKIYDGMVLLQKIPPTLETFGDLSDYLLKTIMHGSCRVSFFVTDHYLPKSVKSMERDRRSNIGLLRMIASRRDQPRPKQFDKFLRHSSNKLDLIKFLVNDWSTNNQHALILNEKEVYVTCEDKAYCITASRGLVSKTPVPDLSCQQEEADTKMFLCSQYAAHLGFDSVKIITVDSDVAILALYFQTQLEVSIYLEMGTGSRTKIFNIASNTIPDTVKKALPALHALSGCDSTSCFNGLGKVKCLKVMQSDERFLDAASLVGEDKNLSSTVKEVLEEFVCKLYGAKQDVEINEARYRLFSKVRNIPAPHKLPPTRDALYLHFDRVNYQCHEWKNALDSNHVLPNPVNHGWTEVDGKLSIYWITNKPAPETVLEFVSCECRKSRCVANQCRCYSVGLRCTDSCRCMNCENVSNNEVDDSHEDDEENFNDSDISSLNSSDDELGSDDDDDDDDEQ